MKTKITHKKMIELTRPAYLLGLWGGVITLAVSLSLLMKLFNIGSLSLFFQVSVFVHLLISILMLISVYLLRKEHHCFGGKRNATLC